jgi:hypothetical protein
MPELMPNAVFGVDIYRLVQHGFCKLPARVFLASLSMGTHGGRERLLWGEFTTHLEGEQHGNARRN